MFLKDFSAMRYGDFSSTEETDDF